MKIRRLTDLGRAQFRDWLERRKTGELPPAQLVDDPLHTEVAFDEEVDATRQFANRYEFGEYLVHTLRAQHAYSLLSQRNDGVWDWLTVVYFSQVGAKVSKFWHYTVTRRGHSGSLAYRHLVRTAFEMYWRHGVHSMVMLRVDMATWGDLAEQLTSRQNVAYHRGYIKAAQALYLRDGRLVRGAASRVPPAKRRKAGDKKGRGSVGRLALAVRRLCRTYDTHALDVDEMTKLLPLEFRSFAVPPVRQPT